MPLATLSGRRDAGAGLALVTLDIDSELASSYVAPGQYIEVTCPEGAGFFALAGDAGASSWELLVRNSGEAAAALLTRPERSAFEVSRALGAGFPMDRAASAPVVIAVTGSAVSVARPIVRARIAAKERGTSLLIGARAARDVPLTDEVAGWAAAGVRVVLCLSRSELEHDRALLPGVERVEGYVQHVLARAEEEHALVFAAGHDAMLADIRALGSARGIGVVTNI